MRLGKTNRLSEGPHHAASAKLCTSPSSHHHLTATTEAGDILWLDPKTLLVGHGYRTNAADSAVKAVYSRLTP